MRIFACWLLVGSVYSQSVSPQREIANPVYRQVLNANDFTSGDTISMGHWILDATFTHSPATGTTFGFAVGAGGTLLRSSDRGKSWTTDTINLGYPYYLTAVSAHKKDVWAGGSRGTIVRSADFGESWEKVATPLDSLFNTTYIVNDINVLDSLHCVVSTTLPNFFLAQTHLIQTSDAGVTWSYTKTTPEMMISSVSMPSAIHLVVGGYDWPAFTDLTGFIWSTSDGGRSWDTVPFPRFIVQVLMFNCSEGLAGTVDSLYRTEDGGITWHSTSLTWQTGYPYWQNLNHMEITGENRNKVVVQISGNYFSSLDKGKTWIYSSREVVLGATGFATVDGPENLFSYDMNGNFFGFTANTSVRYVEPDNPCASEKQPKSFSLSQNYPNPFNPETKIIFSVVKYDVTSLVIYDLLGREVKKLVYEVKEPGTYSVTWNAGGLSSGVYFYRLKSGVFTETRKLVLIK